MHLMTIVGTISAGMVIFCQSALAVLPSTLFDATISGRVAFSPTSGSFTFSYKVTNSSASRQGVSRLAITHGSADISQVHSPPQWTPHSRYLGETMIYWGYTGEKQDGILAGESEGRFSFVSSHPPALQKWLAASYYIYSPIDVDESVKILAQKKNHFFNNSQSGVVIGPAPSKPRSANEMREFIEILLRDLEREGAFKNASILHSIRVKLDASRRSSDRGNHKASINQLRAASNEINAHTGKAILPTAAAMLMANLDYLISLH